MGIVVGDKNEENADGLSTENKVLKRNQSLDIYGEIVKIIKRRETHSFLDDLNNYSDISDNFTSTRYTVSMTKENVSNPIPIPIPIQNTNV